jgi:hypothetical protein
MQAVIYKRRRAAISPGEREWRVEDHALVTRGLRRERRFRWRDIVSVRLYAHPLRDRPWRYVFELQPKHARKIVIDNAHFASKGEYEDRSESYTAFVRAALIRIAAENPRARALIGETGKRYFFMLILALIGLGVLAFVLATVRTPLDALPFAALIKFTIILLMLPVFWLWVIGALPRGVALDAIPERALPPPCAG